ncbi:MAG: hypothetical protein DDT42_01453 [candidate division WS2 bacterium]|uniref:DUF2283 domain-containing protein n=1 Tax=Psychracetigena formicireducens TaxID=2986056 RepID=A0A9E2BHC2_PSYF1|nr:hypothetical protein [Candidatus Psychracetigena formicireducens]
MKIWYDKGGDYLEIGFEKEKGFMKDIGNDMWERNEEGKVVSISIFNLKKRLKKGKSEVRLLLGASFKETVNRKNYIIP